MRLLIRAVVFLVVIVVALLGIGFLLPEQANVERSESINAPPATVFALVNSFRQFDKWSPWADKDKEMKVERSGPESGVGARYTWSGNAEVGSGSQEIVVSKPNSEVIVKLKFEGFSGASEATYTIAADGEGGSKITWALFSHLGGSPINRYFGLFMDKMVGPDYTKGLAQLKKLAETMPRTDFSSLNVEMIVNKPMAYAYVSGSTTTEGADIAKALAVAYGKVGAFMQAAGLKQAGAPLTVARRWDPEAKVYDFDAGIPVDRVDAPAPDTSEVKYGKTPEGTLLKVTHKGPYATLGSSYEMLEAYQAAYGFKQAGNTWEQYMNDPGNTPEADLITTVNAPVI